MSELFIDETEESEYRVCQHCKKPVIGEMKECEVSCGWTKCTDCTSDLSKCKYTIVRAYISAIGTSNDGYTINIRYDHPEIAAHTEHLASEDRFSQAILLAAIRACEYMTLACIGEFHIHVPSGSLRESIGLGLLRCKKKGHSECDFWCRLGGTIEGLSSGLVCTHWVWE